MRRTSSLILVLAVLLWVVPAAFAQKGGATQPAELSDKDKKKMAEIAQQADVQAEIQEVWAETRLKDLDYAYKVNTSYGGGYGNLYDNPILAQYVNTLGQSLVPKDSSNLYAFRLVLDPMPKAESLSTGTIIVSTGLVAMLDNEAQLSYVLAHEIAHLERQHQYNAIRNAILERELMEANKVANAKKRMWIGLAAAAAGGAIGGLSDGGSGAQWGAGIGALAGTIAGQIMFRNKMKPTNWDVVNENEADEAGLKYMLERNYDAREIPRLYARLDRLVGRDSRVGLGFIGSPTRVKERTAQIQGLLTSTYKAEIEARMKTGLVGSSGNFAILMSSLKRDNGVVALDFDLFAAAQDSLEEAARLRPDDPRVHYYLGKLMAATGRTPEDKQKAIASFMKAIQYDAERGQYPEPHLEQALHLIQTDPAAQEQIKAELKQFVTLFQRAHGGAVPSNINIIYDYLRMAGDNSWFVPPVSMVTTKYVDPLIVTTSATPTSEVPPVQLKK